MKLPDFIIRWLFKKAVVYAFSRDPDLNIGGDDNPYMKRWWVWRRNERFINCYIHRMLRDDDDVLHDHPWWSVSIVLHAPNLWERIQTDPPHSTIELRRVKTGQVIFRNARTAHQLIVPREAWTLFFTGPVIRSWGFWCPRGWRHWKDYVKPYDASKGGGVSLPGRGCGEM